ncbi:MAG: hypothetical protein ACI88H_002049 [Cocleimonas sp.]
MNELQRLRIGHYCSNEGKLDFGILKKDFSQDCYNELQGYSKVIFDLQPIAMLFEAVQINFNELNVEITKGISITKITNPGKGMVFEYLTLMSKLSVKITNFITSANSFLSNSETLLKKTSEHVKWNEYRNNLHKNSFSYRFVYELRNYSQHYSLPISSLNVSVDKTIDQTTLLVNMKRDELLSCGYKWGKHKKDIEGCDAVFDLYPHLNEYMKIIEKLFSKYIEVRNIQLRECIAYFEKLNIVFQFPEHTVPVIFVGETEHNKPVPEQHETIPFENLNWLLSICKKAL